MGPVWNPGRIGSRLIMARTGHNLRTSYFESNEVLPRPYQKILVVSFCFWRCYCPPFIEFFHSSAELMFLGRDWRARPDDPHRLLRADLAGTCRIPRHRRVHHGHSYHPSGSAVRRRSSGGSISGAIVGFIVGLPSLRFRHYLAISTLAMHYAIIFLATTYQSNFTRSASAGLTFRTPRSARLY